MINWNKFAKEVHAVAVDKGWWDKPVSFDDVICDCLVHLGRAYEQYRRGRPNRYHLCVASGDKRNPCEWDRGMPCPLATGELACEHRDPKPEGVAVELADCVLRLMDYLATADVDIDAEMGFVPSGDTLPGLVCDCTRFLAKAHISTTAMDGSEEKKFINLIMCIDVIKDWFAKDNISMESILREKHEYNKTRPYRHGGKRL